MAKRDNRSGQAWLERTNPLQGLSIRDAQSIFDAARGGDTQRLHWLFQEIEAANPVLLTCVERRASALAGMPWKVDARASAKDQTLADEQRDAVDGFLSGIENLSETFEHLDLAFFRGFSHAQPIWEADGTVRTVNLPDSWLFVRDPATQEWSVNPECTGFAEGLQSCADARLVTVTRRRPIDYPALDVIKRLGTLDFSSAAPKMDVKPGATIKIPVSSVDAADEYNASTNNYRTGSDTEWAELTAKHFLKGYDITGVDVDKGVNAGRIKNLFSSRAGSSIAAAALATVASALSGTTTSTGVTCPAVGTATIDDYIALAHAKDWLNPAASVLALKGTEMAAIKKLFIGNSIAGSDQQLASYLGFKDMVVVPGQTARMCIVPEGALGCLARVPTYVARYLEAGAETDPDTGLSVGIVLADDQDHNRLIINGDIWFGAAVQSCAAAASKAGIINVGTST